MTVQYLVGDVREVMATIADGSVDLIATSPARYHEVKRALYGTPAPQPGQGVLAL